MTTKKMFKTIKDENVKATEFLYELYKGGDKEFFTKKEIHNAILRAMELKELE